MIERALDRVYGSLPPEVAAGAARIWRLDIAISSVVIALCVVFLPIAYAQFFPGLAVPTALSGVTGRHIWLNCFANIVVAVSVLRLNDRFDRKLAAVLTRTLVVHGLFGFVLLITRGYHSNQVMLSAALASILLGAGVMAVKHRALRPRVAFLGPWDPMFSRLPPGCDWVSDPKTDLHAYDVILTSNVTDLSHDWAEAVSRAMLIGRRVRFLAEYVEESGGIVSLEHFDLDHLPTAGLTSYRTRKRLMDIGLVVLTLPVTLTLVVISALAIRLNMGGPAIFAQTRVGLGGKTFTMYKLRTMHLRSEADVRATDANSDFRITPLGRWLRRFRLDELPQLWNVLIGDMSVIGPRPEWTLLSDRYVEDLPVYAYRHLVRPGITGWAQVMGGYASDLEETRTKVGYDLFYIKNLSFSLDMQILARTVWTLATGKGAR